MGRATGGIQKAAASARRTSSAPAKRALPWGVIEEKYPRAFEPGHPFFARTMLDCAVDALPAWDSTQTSSVDALSDLMDEVGAARAMGKSAVHSGLVPLPSVVCSPPGEPLHALVIERVPTWAKEHTKSKGKKVTVGKRWGEHLGIGVYVYDQSAESWYKRVLHGRSNCAAIRFPLASFSGAEKRMLRLQQTVLDGGFSAATTMSNGYPTRLSKANESLKAEAHAAIKRQRLSEADRLRQQEALRREEQRRQMTPEPERLLMMR